MIGPIPRPAVLVIDADLGIRDLLRSELSHEGYDVATVGDGDAGIALARQRRFDLAVADSLAPGPSAAATLAALKEAQPEIEVVVVAGDATVESAIECMRNGAYDYLRKPFDLEKMFVTLSRALEKSRLQGTLLLYAATQQILATLDEGELARRAADVTRKALRAGMAALVVPDPRGSPGGMQTSGVGPTGWTAAFREIAREALRGGGCQIATGAAVRAMAGPPVEDAPECVAGFPLQGRGGILGVLVAARAPGAAAFSHEEIRRGTVLATQVAMAMENARLFQDGEIANERLRALDERRKAFLAVASHELRTPLTVVYGYLRLLGDSPHGEWTAAQRDAIAAVYANALRLLHYVNNLLEASQIEAGRVVLRCTAVSPEEVFARTAKHLEPILRHREVRVALSIPPEATVHADGAALEQIATNLLTNAAKYTPRGTAIEIGAVKSGATWILSVRDRGPGMNEKTRAVLFTSFGRGDMPEEQFQKGSGLGLLIARSLAEAMGGLLTTENHPDGGAVLHIVLPESPAGRAEESRSWTPPGTESPRL